jgi:hypothetical protein
VERRARLILWRLAPPFRAAVSVRRISVGGFLDLVRSVAPKAAKALLAAKGPLTNEGLIHACADADTLASFADLVCEDQPIGFLRPWLHGRLGGAFARRNTAALLSACREVEGDGQWTRFLGCLNQGGGGTTAKKERGGLAADVVTLCQMGLGRYADLLAMPMQDFLNLCDALNLGLRAAENSDPLVDPDCEASDVNVPGLFKVH